MVDKATEHERRKDAQLRICLDNDVQSRDITTGLERYRLVHQALPEIDWEEIDLSVSLLGKRLRAPVLISPMTGGCGLGARVNRHLAEAAQRLGLAMGVGSQRTALVDRSLESGYRVRDLAPDIFLMGNLGAVQLNAGFGLEECCRAVEMIAADALCLHLNALQELQQGGGDLRFHGLLQRIAEVCRRLPFPVVAKEVGWGMSEGAARALASSGVGAIDVSGAGGTSWYLVEQISRGATRDDALRSPFASWGIPTAESLLQAVGVAGDLPVIASGGIRNGVDAAKALAMGATLVGVALPLLRPATEGVEAVVAWLEHFILELRTAMFGIGAADIPTLRQTRQLARVK